jgi:excisionase family DNA binding protein
MERLLTLDEAAEKLQVDKESIRNYLTSGKLKGHKIAGWMWRVKEKDLEAFVEENTNVTQA